MTMTTSAYKDLLEGSFLYEVQESVKKYHCLTERHIQVMWLEQKYFSQLRTEEGDLIEVISPGIWNGEGGPDFKRRRLESIIETFTEISSFIFLTKGGHSTGMIATPPITMLFCTSLFGSPSNQK
jgi:hypothetical protein